MTNMIMTREPISRGCRIFIGLVFIFSALSKGVDIFAFFAKIQEYITALNFSLPDHLYEISAISIIGIELLLGIFILKDIFVRWTKIAVIFLLSVFSILTLLVAINGNMFDCGCFGSLIPTSPWMSFIKNVLLLTLTLATLTTPVHTYNPKKISFLPETCVTIIFCLSLLFNQPLIDSGYYRPGSDLIVNGRDLHSTDIEFTPYQPKEITSFVIIKDFRKIDHQTLKRYINYASNDPERTLILTASTPKQLRSITTRQLIFGYMDHSSISKLLFSNTGILTLDGTMITDKWQRDPLDIQHFLKESNVQNIFKLISYSSALLLLCISTFETLISIMRVCRKTHQRVGTKVTLL